MAFLRGLVVVDNGFNGRILREFDLVAMFDGGNSQATVVLGELEQGGDGVDGVVASHRGNGALFEVGFDHFFWSAAAIVGKDVVVATVKV